LQGVCRYSGVPGLSTGSLNLIWSLGKFFFYFSRILGNVVDCVNVNPSARVALKPCLA